MSLVCSLEDVAKGLPVGKNSTSKVDRHSLVLTLHSRGSDRIRMLPSSVLFCRESQSITFIHHHVVGCVA